MNTLIKNVHLNDDKFYKDIKETLKLIEQAKLEKFEEERKDVFDSLQKLRIKITTGNKKAWVFDCFKRDDDNMKNLNYKIERTKTFIKRLDLTDKEVFLDIIKSDYYKSKTTAETLLDEYSYIEAPWFKNKILKYFGGL